MLRNEIKADANPCIKTTMCYYWTLFIAKSIPWRKFIKSYYLLTQNL